MKIHKVLFNRVGYRAAGIRYRLAAKTRMATGLFKLTLKLSWCWKILNADGLLILTTPTLAGNIVIRLFFDKGHDHVAIYSKQELQKIIREAGFHVEKYQTFEAGMNQLVIARKERIIEGNGSGN